MIYELKIFLFHFFFFIARVIVQNYILKLFIQYIITYIDKLPTV